MTWKVFTAASVSLLTLVFPQNGISCGPTEDPQDYFTSFFHHQTVGNQNLRPYYYSSLVEFYDAWEDDSIDAREDRIAREWSGFLGTDPGTAAKLVYHTSQQELEEAVTTLKNSGSRQPTDPALLALTATRNLEAANYLVLMRRSERLSDFDPWTEQEATDSNTINAMITQAEQGWKQSKNAFLQPRWAFQRCKLAFYNGRYEDCVRWYDQAFPKPTGSSVQQLALSYKAGALYRLERRDEAAYAFAQTFMYDSHYRKSDFRGFRFSTRDEHFEYTDEEDNKRRLDSAQRRYIAMGKNKREQATITAMFGLNDIDPAPDHLERAWQLDPTTPLLPVLAVRAINKLEEFYLTPALRKEKGGKELYLAWDGVDEERLVANRQHLDRTRVLLEKIATDRNTPGPALYTTGAAYLAYMAKDYGRTRRLIDAAQQQRPSVAINDQLQVLNLLMQASEPKALTPDVEARILPSINWLINRAKTDIEYQYFLRNFFSQVMAQRYEQQGRTDRAALAYGMADQLFHKGAENYYLYSNTGIDYLHEEMATREIEKLYTLMSSPARTPFENLLVQQGSITRDQVIDMMGTTYLRDGQYSKAIEWLKKAGRLDTLIVERYYSTGSTAAVNADPFFDYLNDWNRYDKSAPVPYTKLSFAQKLLGLLQKADTIKNADARSRTYYQIGSALYNISYYGNAWSFVAYDRRTTEWYRGDYELNWQKEYYGVFRARQFYQKAFDAATNKEFKAACLFMVAKCAQRQIPGVNLYDGPGDPQWMRFYRNDYFPRFQQEFGNTKFYQYTYNRCSYLRDFVNRKN